MKIRNKKTGEIKEVIVGGYPVSGKTKMWECSEMDYNEETGYKILGTYNSLAELNDEWEDYEDNLYYLISAEHKGGYICALKEDYKELCDTAKELGIGFETEKEAQQAVEKLRAWKRLKEANIDYKLSREYDDFAETMHANVSFSFNSYPLVGKDLDLLFSGEDN